MNRPLDRVLKRILCKCDTCHVKTWRTSITSVKTKKKISHLKFITRWMTEWLFLNFQPKFGIHMFFYRLPLEINYFLPVLAGSIHNMNFLRHCIGIVHKHDGNSSRLSGCHEFPAQIQQLGCLYSL